MVKTKILDLEKHISLISSNEISKIVKPLSSAFDIVYFRYLKLYKNGKRIPLSNHSDALRYMYEQGNYKHMFFDGEFPAFLKPGWYSWNTNRLLIGYDEVGERVDQEINKLLGIYHGISFVSQSNHFYEIFSFDTAHPEIYSIDKKLLHRFIFYFREQARKIIAKAEQEKLCLPVMAHLNSNTLINEEAGAKYLEETKTQRFYLGGQYSGVYLTAKEMSCVEYLIQGKTAKEISVLVGCAVKTVEQHIQEVKLKLNCHKQTELIQRISLTDILNY